MEDADLVGESLHQTETDLVLRVTVRGDILPVAVDLRGERLVGRQPLPREALCPPPEEGTNSLLGLATPELPKDSLSR